MNTKTTKFLAVLAVMAMAFAGVAIAVDASDNDAGTATVVSIPSAGITEAGNYFVPTGTDAVTIDADGLAVNLYVQASHTGATLTIEKVGSLMVYATTATTVGEIEYLDGVALNLTTAENGVKVITGTLDSEDVTTQFINMNMPLTGSASVYTMGTYDSSVYTYYPAVLKSTYYTPATYYFQDASITLQDYNAASSVTTSLKLTSFTGGVTVPAAEDTILVVDSWTAGDLELVKGAAKTGSSAITTAGDLTITAGTFTAAAAITTSGDITVKDGATMALAGNPLSISGALNVYETLSGINTLTISGTFSNKSNDATGAFAFNTGAAVLNINSSITYNGMLDLTGADTSATIAIASGKTFTVTNTGNSSESDKAYGINADSALTVSGDGTLAVSVSNNNTTSVSMSPAKLNAFGIYDTTNITITSNVSINATGTLKADSSEGVFGVGIYADDGTLTLGNTTTASKRITVTANDRAIHADATVTMGKITINATGGEYAIKANTITTQDTTLTAKISNPNSNKGSDDGTGDGYVAINTKSFTVNTTEDTTGSTIKADSIIVKASDAFIINGTSKVTVTKNASALLSNAAKYTSSGSAFETGSWEKNMYGLIVGTYATLSATPVAYTALITVGTVTLANSATLEIEAGCGILAKVKSGTSDILEFKPSKGEVGSISDATATYKVQAVPLIVGGSSSLILGVGSVTMDGYVIKGSSSDYTIDSTTGDITVTGDVELTGIVGVNIIMADAGANILVPAGETLKFENTKITLGANTTQTMKILGEVTGAVTIVGADATHVIAVTATNPDAAQTVITGATVKKDDNMAFYTLTATAATDEAAVKYLLTKYTFVGIVASGSYTSITLSENFELENGKKIYLGVADAGTAVTGEPYAYKAGSSSLMTPSNAVDIIVGSSYELAVSDSAIIDYSSDKTSTLDINGALVLDGANVSAIVDVDSTTGYVSIKNRLINNQDTDLIDDQSVGYGNILNMKGIKIGADKTMYVYGTLNFEDVNTVAYGGKIVTYYASNLNIEGTLKVEGTVNTMGSTYVTGDVEIYRAGGSATWTNSGYGCIIVADGATFNINKGNSDTNANTLTSASAYGFYLYGSSNISGTFAGTMVDYGTLVFNGTSNNSTVYLRNGVTATFSSVAGAMYVSDDDAAYDDTMKDDYSGYKEYAMIYDGNSFTLQNVKNVIVASTVKETAGSVTLTDETVKSVKYYVSTLSIVSNTKTASIDKTTYHYITAAGGSVEQVAYSSLGGKWSSSVSKGCAEIGDFTVGKKGSLIFTGSNNITVSGTVTVVDEDAVIQFNNSTNNVTVNGTIYANDDKGFRLSPSNYNAIMTSSTYAINGFSGKVNATYFYVDDAAGDTNYYLVPFTVALPEILNADDDTIYIYGTQTLKEDATIPADGNVIIQSGATMKINKTSTVTVADGALLDGSAGAINVVGVLVVENKNSGLKYSTNEDNFKYQVKVENGNVVTYAGIEGALARAEAGDVIEMSQKGEITSDAVIPEGVVLIVPSKIVLTIGSSSKEITLTVNGQLQVQRNASVVSTGEDVTIITNGSILIDNAYTAFEDFEMENFVAFIMKVDGRDTYVVSNLTFASENATDGLVVVNGSVSAGEIAFTPAKDKEIQIIIPSSDVSTERNAMAVVSLALNNKTTIFAQPTGANAGIFNGTILAPSVDGVATIDFEDATGFIFQAYMVETAAGEVYHAILDTYEAASSNEVDGFDGSIEILSGVVEVDSYSIYGVTESSPWIINQAKTSAFLYVGPEASLVIATGAFLYVVDHEDLYYDSPMAKFDGTLVINGTMGVTGYTVVNGLMTVVKEKSSSVATVTITAAEMDLGGDLIVSNDKTLGGSFAVTLYSSLLVGEDASVTGPLTVDAYSYINVYEGADVDYAMLNWDAATETSKAIHTDVYVFGVPYVTTYTHANAAWSLIGTAITADTVIVGCDVAGSYNTIVSDYYKYWFTDITAEDNLKTAKSFVGVYDEVYFNPAPAVVYGTVTVGVGLTLFVDGKNYEPQSYYGNTDYFTVGTHSVYVQYQSGYEGDDVTIKFNGSIVPVTATGGTFTITADMQSFTLVADGAEPYTPEPTPEPEKESEWTVTTILLCVLVVLIAIMAVIVALRLNRN